MDVFMNKIGRPMVMTADERRQEIFNVAETLFGTQGFEHVTMAEIAEAAGMSKKTLYVHFADKRELLKSLVSSSYIWSEDAFNVVVEDAIARLQQSLYMIAQHVLSERHIKLCRLAIAEQVGIEGLSDTFYDMGIATSRNYLIQRITDIPNTQYVLNLPAEVLADMIFGACINPVFIDALFDRKTAEITTIYKQIDIMVQTLFNP